MKNGLISARIHVRLYCSTVSTEHDMSGMLYDDCIIKILGGKKIGEVSQPAYWLAFPFYWVSHHYKSNSNSHGLMMLLNYLGATSEYCQCFMSWVLCKKSEGYVLLLRWGWPWNKTRISWGFAAVSCDPALCLQSDSMLCASPSSSLQAVASLLGKREAELICQWLAQNCQATFAKIVLFSSEYCKWKPFLI